MRERGETEFKLSNPHTATSWKDRRVDCAAGCEEEVSRACRLKAGFLQFFHRIAVLRQSPRGETRTAKLLSSRSLFWPGSHPPGHGAVGPEHAGRGASFPLHRHLGHLRSAETLSNHILLGTNAGLFSHVSFNGKSLNGAHSSTRCVAFSRLP